MQPGEVCHMLIAVVHGALWLDERGKPGRPARQYEVTEGQFLVVNSAINASPTRMSINSGPRTSLLMLTHQDLQELSREYPALRTLSARMPPHSRQLDRDVFCGHCGVPGL